MLAKSSNWMRWAALTLCAAATLAVRADTVVTFSVDMTGATFVPGTDTVEAHGTFNAWAALNLVQVGSSSIYTNTATDTLDTNGGKMEYKFVINGSNYENPATYGHNRAAHLPITSGASLVLPTATFNDAGTPASFNVTFQVDMSQQINLGAFANDTGTVEVQGKFNNWASGSVLTRDTSILRTNQFGLVSSNVYTGTFPATGSPGAADQCKFVIQPGNYEGVGDPNNYVSNDPDHNRYFSDVDQTLPVVFFGDAPFAPLSVVTFSVDMSVVALTDTNYNPASVTINGDVMGWGGTAMTNNPSAPNTNIYTSPALPMGQGSSATYQYRYTQLSPANTVYDHLNGANGGNDNRFYQVPAVAATNVAPVIFNDAALNDYLLQPTPVLFSVDMNGAVGTDAHAFSAANDNVYINGQFANWYAWSGGVNPTPAPGGYQMIQQGSSTIYTNTIIFPAGTAISVSYKYGMDPLALNGGPSDDEAGFGQNHSRVVRNSALNPYVMATDTFGNMYGEPYFNSGNTAGGNLTMGPASGGTIPVKWLGRPGASLQVTANLTGAWQTVPGTDGTNWTIGSMSANGFVSQTNWPATNNAFFRLVKP